MTRFNSRSLIFIFVQLLLISACTRVSTSNYNTEIHPVGFDAVVLSGDLAERINRNFDRMETDIYQPARVFWSEEESGGWPADKEGRAILALVLDSRASNGRHPVYLDSLIKMLPSRLNERGYLGTVHEDIIDEQQLSGHGWLLRGLCEYFEWTGDSAVLDVAKGVVENLFIPIGSNVSKYPIDPQSRKFGIGGMSGSAGGVVDGWRLSSDIGCVFIGMDGLVHYYYHDRSSEIKAVIDSLVELFLRIDLVGIHAQTHASLTAMRGLLRYADITGDRSLVDKVRDRWKIYRSYGMTENFENYNWFGRYDTWTEPCAIVDSYMVAVQLWMLTRNSDYLNDAEHIFYNAICATQRENGGFGCNKPIGPCYHSMEKNCDEAHWCCTMRGGEGLGRAAEYSCFLSGDTLFLPFYNNCVVHVPNVVSISVATDYPYGDNVSVVVDSASISMLAMRIPDFMTVRSLMVNGEIAAYHADRGFAVVDKVISAGDHIILNYVFEPYVDMPFNSDCLTMGKKKVMSGPYILGNPHSRCVFVDTVDAGLNVVGNHRVAVNGEILIPLCEIEF